MADQDTTIPTMDDKELFQSAMADEPRQETPAPAPEPQSTEQPRDEQGRFTATQETTTTEAAPTQPQTPAEQTPATQTENKDDPGGQVPSWRLREVSEGRQAAERRAEEASRERAALQQQLQQMHRELADLRKPKEQPVDFFADPDAALSQRLSPVEERFARLETQVRLNSSRAVAIATHGAKAVSDMEAAVGKASAESHPEMPHLAARMRASDDPVLVAMNWYQAQEINRETGGDIKAYRQKVLDDAMKDPQFQAKVIEAARVQATGNQSPNTRPNIQLPPSLNKAPGAGVSNAPDDGDMSDRSLFKYAMSSPRR